MDDKGVKLNKEISIYHIISFTMIIVGYIYMFAVFKTQTEDFAILTTERLTELRSEMREHRKNQLNLVKLQTEVHQIKVNMDSLNKKMDKLKSILAGMAVKSIHKAKK